MAVAFMKQPGSHPSGGSRYQVLQYNSATVFTTKFGPNTQQIRIVSQIGGWGTVNDTTADATIATSAGGVGMIITGLSTFGSVGTLGSGWGPAEYFSVVPGQIFTFSSTSTSTGACSVTEMS